MMEYLKGKRTYIVAAILILTAILGFLDGNASIVETAEAILIALGLGTLRAGVANDTK